MAVTKKDRIDLRISEEDKKLLEQAATYRRMSLSTYIVSAAMKEAEADLQREQQFVIAKEDRERLMALLDNPSEPTEALKKRFRE